MFNPILVVEDNDDLSLLFRLTLESAGYQVKAIDNGKDIFRHLQEFSPQLVIMDIMMPEINGLQVSRKIKQRKDYQGLPILLVSAIDRLEEEQLSNSRANGIIYKPFDLDDLIYRIDNLATQPV